MLKKILLTTIIFISYNVWASVPIWSWYFVSDKCPKDKPIAHSIAFAYEILHKQDLKSIKVLDCLSCDEPKGFPVVVGYERDFKRTCPNRKIIDNKIFKIGHISTLKTCPPELPLKNDENGGCLSCDNTKGFFATNCEVCPNRYYENKSCILKKCPDNLPMQTDAGCYPCGEFFHEYATEKGCNSCPNLEYVDGKCILKRESK